MAPGILAGADFTYINTVRSSFQRDLNLGDPVQDITGRHVFTNARKTYPDFSIVQITESSAGSLYRGFTYTFNIRKPRFTLDTYYTLSWKYSHDDAEQDYSAITYDNATNLNNEYTYSLTDQRHQFVAYGICNLAFGFDISSTSRLSSARPFEVMSMWDSNRDDMLNDRPMINGVPMGRNAFRSRPFYDVSLRLQKNFTLPNEKGRLTASVEFFNLFGFDNVQIGHPQMHYGHGTEMVGGVVTSTIGPESWYDPISRKTYTGGEVVTVAPPANFNELRDANGEYFKNNIPGDPFQMQLGLRFQF